jgi:K+-sensing histidine kinase KdpD
MAKRILLSSLTTFAIVALTVLANYLLNAFTGIDSPMLAFCLGITVAAWFSGFWQGVFATALSFAAVIFIFSKSSVMASQQMWVVRCVIFCANGLLTSFVCGKLRDSRQRVAEYAELLRAERNQETLRALDELRASRTFLDSIVENLPNMVFVIDAKTLPFVRFPRAGEEH